MLQLYLYEKVSVLRRTFWLALMYHKNAFQVNFQGHVNNRRQVTGQMKCLLILKWLTCGNFFRSD